MMLTAMMKSAKNAMVAIALLVLGIARVGLAAQMIDPAKIVDLTYTFDASTIYWPTEKGFVHEFEKNGDTPEHYFYAAARLRGARAWRDA